MNINEYQKAAMTTCTPESANIQYMGLGLASEAGEVAGKIKKQIRDGVWDKHAVAKELGDVLWYVSGLASIIGFDLKTIAKANLSKLAARRERGTIHGEGDDR